MGHTLLRSKRLVNPDVGSGSRARRDDYESDRPPPDGDELADFGKLDDLLDVMPTEPAPPPSWRGRLADRIEAAGAEIAVRAWDLATIVRGA